MYQDSQLQWFLSLGHSGEGGGSSPEMLQSSKKLQNDSFSKLFVRVARGAIGERKEILRLGSGLQ